jgi:hypothetical protein
LTASSQSYCLTGEQVKKLNYLLDHRDQLIQWSEIDSATIDGYISEVDAMNQLLAQSQRESANMDTLRLIAVERSHKLDEALNKAQKRAKRRARMLWIVGTVAAVEAVVIGLSVGLK